MRDVIGASPGGWERPPPPELAALVRCVWRADWAPGPAPLSNRVLPDGCVDVVWKRGQMPAVAGPDTGPQAVAVDRPATFVGIRFRPGAAPVVLGPPADELLDQRVALDAIWPQRTVQELSDRLDASADPETASNVLIDAVTERVHRLDQPEPDAVVTDVVSGIAGGVGPPRPLPLGSRQIRRRFAAAVGYGPRTFERVVRFRRFLELAGEPSRLSLASLAATAGYADQPHLTRECRRLAGATPAELVPRSASG